MGEFEYPEYVVNFEKGLYTPEGKMKRPPIVCLCGSTKFKKEYEEATIAFGLKGYIVLSVVGFNHADGLNYTEEQKAGLDKLHKQKIDLADGIFVINPGGYIGSSTRSEIEHARKLGNKQIYYLVSF